MPRLAVDEPEQRGKATGPPPRPKAERTAPAPKRKRASPKTTAQPERKRPSYPSPNKQAQLAALHLQAQAKPMKERAKAAKALAKEYNVGPQYPRQVAKKVIAKKKLATRKGVGGQNQRITAEDELMIRAKLKEHAYELTFRQLEEKTGIAKSTLQRFMRKHKWRQVAKGTRPHLTEGNISGRLLRAQENEKNDWWDHVDLDEKWFYVWSKRVKAPRDRYRNQLGPEIQIFPQEPNSPCTNGNDLGFYNSMDSWLPGYRNFNLNDFEKQVMDCYWSYPPEKLDALFQTKTAVCTSIIAADGRNDFKLPHERVTN